MNDQPQRLLEGGDDMEVALLRSAKPDAPSGDCMRKTMMALGLTSGVAAAASAATAASMPPAAAAATKGGIAALLSGVTVKWIGVAGVAGLITWGAVTQLQEDPPPEPQTAAAATPAEHRETERETAPSQRRTAPSQAAPADAVAEVAPEEEPDAPVVDPPPTQGHAARPTNEPSPANQPKAAKPTLSDEVAALDKARKAMDEDPEAALAELDKVQGGVLAQEADVLRIEALARAGKKDQAKAAASAFLAKHPNSPLASRVRRAIQ